MSSFCAFQASMVFLHFSSVRLLLHGRRLAIDFRCRPVSCLTTRFYHFLVKGLSSVERFLDFCVRGLSSLGHVGGYWAGRRLRLIVFGKRGKDPLQYFGTGRKSSPLFCEAFVARLLRVFACSCLVLLALACSCLLLVALACCRKRLAGNHFECRRVGKTCHSYHFGRGLGWRKRKALHARWFVHQGFFLAR